MLLNAPPTEKSSLAETARAQEVEQSADKETKPKTASSEPEIGEDLKYLEFGDRVKLRDGEEAAFHKFVGKDKAEVIADGAYVTVPVKSLKIDESDATALKSVAGFADAILLKNLYNKDGEFDYEQVKTLAGRIGSGELKITRLAPREEQGRNSGGRRNVEASIIAGAEARTSQTASQRGRQTRKEKLAHNRQVETHLEKYARHEGIWFDYDEFTKTYQFFAEGQEAQVFEDTNKEFVLKAVNYAFGSYGISLLDFIDNRISLYNYLFPETKYELVGFTRDGDGRFRFILRQPFIVGDIPHPSKRRAYMRRVLGAKAEALTPEQYINSDYHIWDLHLKNLLQDKDGNVFVIDSLLELNTPDRHLGGVREYEEFGIKRDESDAALKSVASNESRPPFDGAKELEITKIKGDEITNGKISPAQVIEFYKSPNVRRVVVNKDTNQTIRIFDRAIRASLKNHKPLTRKAFAVLPELLERAAWIGFKKIQPSKVGKEHLEGYDDFVAPIEIDGKLCVAKIKVDSPIVKKNPLREKGYYYHTVVEIEVAESPTSQAEVSKDRQSLRGKSATVIRLDQLLPNFKPEEDNDLLKQVASGGGGEFDTPKFQREADAIPIIRNEKGKPVSPNGKESKLSERLWQIVRHPNFKRWFGDWELAAKYNLIQAFKTIKITRKAISKDAAKALYKNLPKAVNKYDRRQIKFVAAAFDKISGHKERFLLLRLAPQLNSITEEAIPISFESEREPDKSNNIVGFHNYLAKVNLDGKDYYLRITAQELKTGQKKIPRSDELHSAFISDVEIVEAGIESVSSAIIAAATETQTGFDKILANFLRDAKSANEKVSKVVIFIFIPKLKLRSYLFEFWRPIVRNFDDLKFRQHLFD
ncbi:MAG: hypothetical protein H0W58_04420 [Acidobacteria bacterium]|nr:hypothetical protein [Acidobacteriota bacterium]